MGMRYYKSVSLEYRWLCLAIFALAMAGLLSIVIVLLRLPIFYTASFKHFFDLALGAHVNLAVNIWMFSILFALLSPSYLANFHLLDSIAWFMALFSTILISTSIFVPNTELIKTNYIPVINNFYFFLGLTLFWCSALINTLLALLRAIYYKDIILGSLAFVILITLFTFVLSYIKMPHDLELEAFYEGLFWGGGHLMQFAFLQGLIIVYANFFNHLTKSIKIILILNAIFITPAPLIYCFFSSVDPLLLNFFTEHMRYFAGLCPFITILYCLKYGLTGAFYKKIGFILSSSMFLYGGLLGFLIQTSDVTIPAHYHGSIVAISIAFMTYIYTYFEKLSFNWASVQLSTYSLGQMMHISGLAWLGGYGALRKTPGMVGNNIYPQLLFGSGGILAVVGGFMFIYLATLGAVRAYKNSQSSKIDY